MLYPRSSSSSKIFAKKCSKGQEICEKSLCKEKCFKRSPRARDREIREREREEQRLSLPSYRARKSERAWETEKRKGGRKEGREGERGREREREREGGREGGREGEREGYELGTSSTQPEKRHVV